MKTTQNRKQVSLSKSNTLSLPSNKSQSKNLINNHSRKSRSKSKNKSNIQNNKPSALNTKLKSQTKYKKYIFTHYKQPNQQSNKNKQNAQNKQNKNILTQPINSLKQNYQNSVSKVFHVLDIFSRGTISQANISRWVPQAALYFLGSVFQKIRNNRLSLTQQQFQQQCNKIYIKSNELDIKQFIESIQSHKNFNEQKISMQGQHKQTIQSHVQDRFSFPFQGDTSFRKIQHIGQKTMPLQTIKSSQVNFIEQKSQKVQKSNKKQSIQDLIQTQSKINTNTKSKSKIKDKLITLSPLTNVHQFQNVAIRSKPKRINDIQNMPLKMTDLNIQTNNLNFNPNNNKIHHIQNKPHLHAHNECQSPFFKGTITNMLSKAVNRRTSRQSQDRIDKLSVRLEDYIKQNAMRLERSKNTRIQL